MGVNALSVDKGFAFRHDAVLLFNNSDAKADPYGMRMLRSSGGSMYSIFIVCPTGAYFRLYSDWQYRQNAEDFAKGMAPDFHPSYRITVQEREGCAYSEVFSTQGTMS